MKCSNHVHENPNYLILFALFISILPLILHAGENKITVLTEEWAPYNYDDKGILKGFSVEVVKYIIKDINADAKI